MGLEYLGMKKHVLWLALCASLLSVNVSCESDNSQSSSSLGSSSSVSNSVSSSETSSSSSSSSSDVSSSSSSSTSSEVSSSSSSSTSSSSSSSSSSVIGSDNHYYDDIDFSKTGAQLKSELADLISDHEVHSYNDLWQGYYSTDVDEDGYIIDIYSTYKYTPGVDQNTGSAKKEGDNYNREHVIPQSIFNKRSPMVSDIFHILPTDSYVNNRRGNYPFAEVSSASYTSTNGTKVGSSATSGVSGTVCEPIDEYKGDIARIYFYFVTCYQDKMSSFNSFAPFSKNSFPSLSNWAIDLYMEWSKNDPVSEREIERNQACYEYQNNRNPFVDIPGLEEQIWG